MRNIFTFCTRSLVSLCLLGVFGSGLYGQACTTTASGSNCTRSSFPYGNILPNNGCGTFNTINPYSPGEYFTIPVLNGACYTVSTCGSPVDTRISAFQGASATTNPFAYNDDNGPDCSAAQASVVLVPNFTDVTTVDVREGACLVGGSSSITVKVRQNNNLTMTSSGADMCAGETRNLSATPASITGSIPTGAGDVGTFSGTGVNGTVFTAPSPAGASQIYTITYTFGYCNVTQDITVFNDPTVSAAGPDQVTCDPSTSLAGNTAAIGNGTWTIVSGPGSLTNAGSPAATVSGLIEDSTTVLVWTISNGPCLATTDTMLITREDAPTTPLAGSDFDICSDTATLGANNITVGQGTWSLIGGSGTIASPTSANSMVTGLAVGPNTFRWTSSNGNCPTLADDVVITRNAPPTLSNAGANQAICDTFAILAGSSPSVGTGTWAVVSGGGTVTSPANPNSTVTGLSVGSNTFVWSITNGICPASNDTLEIIRNSPPAAPTATGNTTVCEGSATMITAASAATSPSYLWWDSIVAGNTLAQTTVLNTGPLLDTTTFWLTVTDGATGCTSDRTPITVDVIPAPMVDLGPDTTVCQGDTVCFDAGAGLAGYVWNTSELTQSICTTTPGMYWVVVTDANNCQNLDTVFLNTNPTPMLDAGMDTEFCTGTSVTIGDVNPDPNATHSWSPSGNTPTISVNAGGTYILTATGTNGCEVSDTVLVTELDVPAAAFSMDTSGCPTILFSDNSTDATSWSWNFGNGTSGNGPTATQNYSNSGGGTYTVTLTVSNICGTDSSSQTLEISCLVGIDPLLSNLSVSLYPNPNQGQFRVSFSELKEDAEIQVFDMTGKEIYQRPIENPNGSHEEVIDLGEVSQGVYFFRLKVGSYQMTKRLVVE